jgi:hypothetical protein
VIDYAGKVGSWPMYLNDQLGDCTAACAGHEVMSWTAYGSQEAEVSDNDVLALYMATGGYVPGDPGTDNGAVIQDVLDYWRVKGIGGHKIVAFAELKSWTEENLRQTLEIFGTVYLGINCPQSAIDQFNGDGAWTYVPGSPIAGGHAIPLQAWDESAPNPGTVITWGKAQPVSMEFLSRYVEEAWVIITQDFIDSHGVTPVEGFNFQQLSEDLSLLTGKPGPVTPPAPVPPAPPQPPPNWLDDFINWFARLWHRVFGLN